MARERQRELKSSTEMTSAVVGVDLNNDRVEDDLAMVNPHNYPPKRLGIWSVRSWPPNCGKRGSVRASMVAIAGAQLSEEEEELVQLQRRR
ncbi:unnamed protein product [Linum trigynum]|uniref:Uncharacterized protein n=1 Tax=Linum trigynum TaxID=586398 RepID=A0AAV2F9B8_9ROSI